MDWFRRNFLLGAVLVLGGAVAAAEGWLWMQGRQQSIRALAALEQVKQERDWLARQSPALSEENERAIARDLANTRLLLAALRTALQGRAQCRKQQPGVGQVACDRPLVLLAQRRRLPREPVALLLDLLERGQRPDGLLAALHPEPALGRSHRATQDQHRPEQEIAPEPVHGQSGCAGLAMRVKSNRRMPGWLLSKRWPSSASFT